MPNNQSKWVRWVYRRGAEGDLELWCETKDEAMRTLKQYGFNNIDPDKLFNEGKGAVPN